jgi:hypothetical protein
VELKHVSLTKTLILPFSQAYHTHNSVSEGHYNTSRSQDNTITMTSSNNNSNNRTSSSISDSNDNGEADFCMTVRQDVNAQKTVKLAHSLRRMKRRLLLKFVEQDTTTIRQSNSSLSESQSCLSRQSSCSSLSCSVASGQ